MSIKKGEKTTAQKDKKRAMPWRAGISAARKRAKAPLLERASCNPIITPSDRTWESWQTFNPAAFYDDNEGKVHLLYRAIGDGGVSVLGYASSVDGISVDERLHYPAYFRAPEKQTADILPIAYISGGGWNGGCEDPRVTVIGDTVYMLYTAFDGWGSLRIALTSISLEDFRNKRWNWARPVLISPPGEIHKNWVLFPEKIKGKYAILHSISPEILVEYIDSLDEFDGTKFIKSRFGKMAEKRTKTWDNWLRGPGPSPIKTTLGWLLLYHAMDDNDPNRYKLGAMILDLERPEKVLYRSPVPVLEPDEQYENTGFKAGVVYCCGAIVKDGTLYVYYGGADSVVCVATAPLDEFLAKLAASGGPKLKKTGSMKVAKKTKKK